MPRLFDIGCPMWSLMAHFRHTVDNGYLYARICATWENMGYTVQIAVRASYFLDSRWRLFALTFLCLSSNHDADLCKRISNAHFYRFDLCVPLCVTRATFIFEWQKSPYFSILRARSGRLYSSTRPIGHQFDLITRHGSKLIIVFPANSLIFAVFCVFICLCDEQKKIKKNKTIKIISNPSSRPLFFCSTWSDVYLTLLGPALHFF